MSQNSALPGDELAPLRPLKSSHYAEERDAEVAEPTRQSADPAATATPATASSSSTNVPISALKGCCSPCSGQTTLFINLCGVMERVDEQLLPALYRYVGAAFHATPRQLGLLTFSRAVVQALSSPLAGLAGHWFNRVHVIAAGAAIWGACCMCFAATSSISQAVLFWAVDGIGLALLIPAAQSLIADLHPAQLRGRAFGLLHFTGGVGGLLGSLLGTNLGHLRPFGMEGWRFAFVLVALASWLIGALTLCFARDPRAQQSELGSPASQLSSSTLSSKSGAAGRSREEWRAALQAMRGILGTPSFLVIIAQGILGTTPWLALVFATLYLQLLGFSDLQASVLVAIFLASNAVGGLLGGLLGDWAARRWPDHGRIAVCQLSVTLGAPLSALIFKGLPQQPTNAAAALFGVVLAITGLCITWAGTACNNPIFAEIVPPSNRNLVFAFDRSFEGAVAACAAPLVGWLSQAAFGFTGAAEVGPDFEENQARARALGSALLVFTAVPWSLCALLFSGLHFTYPRDRDRAAKLAAAAAEAEAEAAKLMPTGADGKPAALELVAVGSADGLSEGSLTQEDKAAPLGSTTDGGRRSSGSVTEHSRGA
ncbi:hypothetical protein ABPG77_008950 [Micractinium sp. CCAP 211/92]